MLRRKIIIWICVILLVGGIKVGTGLCLQEENQQDNIYRSLEIFSDAIYVIQSKYVDEVDSEKLIQGALKGMLNSLDPYSQYLDAEAYEDMQVQTEGQFGGLGIEISIKDGLLTVVSPIDGTPADKAGLEAGDRIIRIDGETTEDITLIDAVKQLRGEPGSEVTVTIFREDAAQIFDVTIVRDIIKIDSLKEAKVIEDNIGYIKLVEFQEKSPRDFRQNLEMLKSGGITGLVIDLRNNPGGLLDSAVEIADMFIEPGKVLVSTKGRGGEENYAFEARIEPIMKTEIPIVILINEGSASGAEILAGVLQDYERAILLGKPTFGKGSVQTVIPLEDGSAIRLTTSKYFLPSGRSIHDTGIAPDVEVEAKVVKLETEEKTKILFDELESEQQAAEIKEELESTDYQLRRAIDLIKGLRIYSKKYSNNKSSN